MRGRVVVVITKHNFIQQGSNPARGVSEIRDGEDL